VRRERTEAGDGARDGGRSANRRGDASVCVMAHVANGAARFHAPNVHSDGYIMATLPFGLRSALRPFAGTDRRVSVVFILSSTA